MSAPARERPGTVDALGRPAGGRFAPAPRACSAVYALLDTLAAEAELADGEVVADDGARVTFYRPVCPHGHFRRWADAIDPRTKGQRNCRQCHPPRGRRP